MDHDVPMSALFSQARRSKGITQSKLATQVSCKQSAISMFERGNLNALSEEKQEAIASILGISRTEVAQTQPQGQGYCPNFDCPTNYPYQVANQLFLIPLIMNEQGNRYCKYCGEVLETNCPNCSSAFLHGACCTDCGSPYIPIPPGHGIEKQADWLHAQRRSIQDLKQN